MLPVCSGTHMHRRILALCNSNDRPDLAFKTWNQSRASRVSAIIPGLHLAEVA
jgi:hypothetical protein